MKVKGLLVAITTVLAQSAWAEPTGAEINQYFNPGPDAYTDLDAYFDLSHQSDMPDSARVLDMELDFDYLQQNIDTQVELGAGGELILTKDDGSDFNFGARYSQRQYVPAGDPIDSFGGLFSFVDPGTADPRSFWFFSAGLSTLSGQVVNNNDDETITSTTLAAGIGRGRTYRNTAFREAWLVTKNLRDSGRLMTQPSSAQLYALAKIIDDWYKSARAAADESHGLARLASIRGGVYRREYFREIWNYLSAQGLVGGKADLDAVFDMRDAIDYRSFSDKWAGGAETSLSLVLFASSEDVGDDNELACERVILDVNRDRCGSSFAFRFDYDQFWPLDFRSQFALSFGAIFDFDFDAGLGAGAGYLQELNDYLLWDNTARLEVNVFDDTTSFLSLSSALEYELGPTSSLVGELTAGINDDGDTNHALTARLQFDLM